ncbi:MAG TPA: hypothetical protein PKA24_14765, partial [Microthrixaceae bacterium]|nr:hypothetical protein [Microthrixaceae bacterium]
MLCEQIFSAVDPWRILVLCEPVVSTVDPWRILVLCEQVFSAVDPWRRRQSIRGEDGRAASGEERDCDRAALSDVRRPLRR